MGCGIATNRDLYKAEYYGVDVTPKFITEAHRTGADAGVASMLHLPFKDGAFDCVCCENVLIHLPPKLWRDALDEMFRVASKMVCMNEPVWKKETRYCVKERYFNEAGLFMIWLNDYGVGDMVGYLCGKGGGKHEVWFHKGLDWQVTVLNLDG